LAGSELHAQYGRGYGGGYGYGSGYGYGYGRQRSAIPQVQETPKEPEPKTAEQIVDGEMPEIAEALELNEFEVAVLSSVLKKYVQKRIEMQILELSPEQMREGMEKITQAQDEELKAGLPPEKYEAFVEMQKKGLQKTKKEKKKERKRKQKKKDKT
jgi:isopropylmalate/homocitrate/citramalate synthase